MYITRITESPFFVILIIVIGWKIRDMRSVRSECSQTQLTTFSTRGTVIDIIAMTMTSSIIMTIMGAIHLSQKPSRARAIFGHAGRAAATVVYEDRQLPSFVGLCGGLLSRLLTFMLSFS